MFGVDGDGVITCEEVGWVRVVGELRITAVDCIDIRDDDVDGRKLENEETDATGEVAMELTTDVKKV